MQRFPQTMLATCCIPWDDRQRFDSDRFLHALENIARRGTGDIYVFGTAGEGYAVSDGDFREIVRVFARVSPALGINPMVGVISLSTRSVIERIEYAAGEGVERIQITLPSWGGCEFPEVRAFFAEVCGRFESCSFLHYNTPRAGRVLSPAEYGILAQAHANLVATKNSNDSLKYIAELHRRAPDLRHFLTEFPLAAAALLGLDPGYLVARGSINWTHAKRFFEACKLHDTQLIRDYVDAFITLGEGIDGAYTGKTHMDGGIDKLYCKVHDPEFPLRLLSPYASTDEASYAELSAFIRERLPDWIDR